MKRHPIRPGGRRAAWLLLACAAASPPCALAESSLAVNGLIDSGVYRDVDGSTQVGTIQRSNLALVGTEDLGGGTSMVLRLSTRFELDTGKSEGAGLKPFWHDEASIGIKGRWGLLRLGRAMTALWANDWKFDPWSNYNRIASPAWQHWHALTPSDPFANNGTAEYGRLNNGIFYDAPTLAGFTLRLSGSPERQPGASGRPYSAVLEHERGPLLLMAAFERNSLGDRATFAAARYRWRATTFNAAWDDSRRHADGARARTATLSGSHALGRVTLKAGMSRQRMARGVDDFASLGADLALSRRTALYASFGQHRQQHGRRAFGVGLGHAF